METVKIKATILKISNGKRDKNSSQLQNRIKPISLLV
jgi:hypothetical protein